MNRTERSTETLSCRTGVLAALRAVFDGRGCGVRWRIFLFVVFATLALVLPAIPAVASPPVTFAESGTGAGQVVDPASVAVDQSTGIVYVADGENQRIDEFDASGHFLMAFGWGVLNGAKELQVCTITCEEGIKGFGPGQMDVPDAVAVDQASHDIYVSTLGGSHMKFGPGGQFLFSYGGCGTERCPIAVDSSGNVWLGEVNRIQELNSSGVPQSQVQVPGIGEITALAVDASGDFYVLGRGFTGVRKLTPSGVPVYTIDESGHPEALTLDGSGHLFVGDAASLATEPYRLFAFDAATGAQSKAFGAGEVIGNPTGNALAFGDTAAALYVVSVFNGNAAQIFKLPAPGPVVRTGSVNATEIRKTTTTLNATVDPEGKATTTHFQYISEKQFKEDGETFGAGTLATPESASIGADFAEHLATAAVTGLKFETTYRFRVIATNSDGTDTGEEAGTFTTQPPLRIDSTSVSEVTSTSATLDAQINPLGEAATYHFEYLTEAAYLENGGSFSGPQPAISVPQPDAGIGSGVEDAEVSRHLQSLSPNTVYRYRVIAFDPVAPEGIAGPALAFTSQRAGGSLVLPDGRAWELVSPPDKHGAGILPVFALAAGTQAAASGDGMAYVTTAPTEAEPAGNSNTTQVLSLRGSGGWGSRDLVLPHDQATGATDTVEEYRVLSTDLSLSVVQPFGPFNPSLSQEASEQTAYLRSDYLYSDPGGFCANSCYRPLVTGAPGFENVSPGTEFGNDAERGVKCAPASLCGPQLSGATPDFSHIVLHSNVGLTATPGDLYEWSDGQLQYVGSGNLGGGIKDKLYQPLALRHAISADGSRVYFTDKGVLYAREGIGSAQARTVVVPGGEYQTASADGSRVFVLGGGELSEFNLETEVSVPLGSGVQGVIGASEDGSSVYFVSSTVLTGEEENGQGKKAEVGQPNLYVSHAGSTTFVATLSAEDSPDWEVSGGETIRLMTARVSPDGDWLAFMSQRSPTGYDNRDAVSGAPDEEVYLYHAAAGGGGGRTLVCASCDPTGARPHGMEYSHLQLGEGAGLVGGSLVWKASQWLAANVPPWTSPYYQSRYLSDSGRLFFNSSDALVPQDTNGTEDVYEYEPPGIGDCTTERATFVSASGGCVGLISSGTSPEESGFLDASENGGDVFFLTAARLSSQDVDSAVDVYDARVGGGFPQSQPPPACEGDACQSPVQAPNDPTPGSLTYTGPGNPGPTTTAPGKITKTIRCVKARKLSHGKCVKKGKRKAKARRVGNRRRVGS